MYIYIYTYTHTYMCIYVYTNTHMFCPKPLLPVPPQIILIFFLPSKGYGALILNKMCLKPTIAPICRECSHCETTPCS